MRGTLVWGALDPPGGHRVYPQLVALDKTTDIASGVGAYRGLSLYQENDPPEHPHCWVIRFAMGFGLIRYGMQSCDLVGHVGC